MDSSIRVMAGNGKNRLEQEKVSQFYVNSQLQKRIPLVT